MTVKHSGVTVNRTFKQHEVCLETGCSSRVVVDKQRRAQIQSHSREKTLLEGADCPPDLYDTLYIFAWCPVGAELHWLYHDTLSVSRSGLTV